MNPDPDVFSFFGVNVEQSQLRRIAPILRELVRCPVGGCLVNASSQRAQTLYGTILHLNDGHRWPRTDNDPNPKGLPTIHGWLKEEAEKNGWDLTCSSTR